MLNIGPLGREGVPFFESITEEEEDFVVSIQATMSKETP
jgi:hypothetical protein